MEYRCLVRPITSPWIPLPSSNPRSSSLMRSMRSRRAATWLSTAACNSPLAAAFSVGVNGGAGPAVNTVAISTTNVTLTLATAVANGDTVTVSYTAAQAGANPIQDVATIPNQALDLVNEAVTNNTADTTPPALVPLPTVDGTSLVLNYDETLATPLPLAAAFSVGVNGGAGPAVNTVAIST
ncbi:MAG: SwmB domain-containing protein, partial [Candidatus Acidiferrales bacterium]